MRRSFLRGLGLGMQESGMSIRCGGVDWGVQGLWVWVWVSSGNWPSHWHGGGGNKHVRVGQVDGRSDGTDSVGGTSSAERNGWR